MTENNKFLANLAKREPVEAQEPEISEPTPRKQKLVPGKAREPGKKGEIREGMKLLSAWVPEDEWRWLRHEAVDHKTTVGALMARALKLLHRERGK